MLDFYKQDLAYIHDIGFSDYSVKSAPGILKILQQSNIDTGLIVELGCGSGLLAQELIKANYQFLGVDISEALINIARQRLPNVDFRVDSLFKVDIPRCQAVISVGECFNYLSDSDNNLSNLHQLFQRIYQQLTIGGLLIFDIAEPGQIEPETSIKTFTEGKDWLVLVEKKEKREPAILTRRIITFRLIEQYYRRDEEIHHLNLYKTVDICQALEKMGFQVKTKHSYGEYQLPKAHTVFIARKT